MNYTYHVAYLNTIRAKKVIPDYVFQELELSKSLSSLISVFKEYKYEKIFTLHNPELELYNSVNFETIINEELSNSIALINSLLLPPDKWISQWIQKFFLTFTAKAEELSRFVNNFQQLNSSLCLELLKLIIDFENIKLFLSYTIYEEAVDEKNFIPSGNINVKKFKEFFPSVESLTKFLNSTYYPEIKLSSSLQKENFDFYFYIYLEKLVYKSKSYYFTIEPIVFYFFEKLIETQKLRKVYYSIKLEL